MCEGFAQPKVKGWCPGLFAPMEAADGWLVRVRPTLGRMEAAQAFLLAEVAEKQGNGRISLTNRASLQLRGFTADAARRFPDIAVAAGLGLRDPGMERRQAMIVSPLAGDDSTCAPGTIACAEALRGELIRAEDLSALPPKFSFAVDGGGLYATGLLQADICIRATEDGLWSVVCGNMRGKAADCLEAVRQAVGLARAFVRSHETVRPLRNPGVGADLFQSADLSGLAREVTHACASTDVVRAGPLGHGLYALSVPMGSMNATMLRECANVAARQGDGILRLTPWHTIVLAGLAHPPLVTGMVTDPHSPLLRIWACSGQSACAQAAGETENLARCLAPFLPAWATLHVSGCRKGCAYPTATHFTLVAGEGGYGLVRNGSAFGVVESLFADKQAVYRAFQTFGQEGAVDADL